MPRVRVALVILVLSVFIAWLATPTAGRAQVGPTDTPTATATNTPAPTGTPASQTTVTLTSGSQLVIVRSWTYGELAIFLGLMALCALYGLHWISEYTTRRGG